MPTDVHPTHTFIAFENTAIEQSIAARFEQQVARYPDRLAVVTAELQFTYAELGVTPIDWTVKRAKLERGEEFLGSIFFSLLRRFVFPFSVVFRHAVEKRLSHLPYNARSHTG